MKLEYQVCSLDLAKRLKELGVKQESYFMWCVDDSEDFLCHELRQTPSVMSQRNRHNNYCAFTVAELGEMLPWYVEDYFWLEITRGSSTQNIWNISYRKVRGNKNHNIIGDIDADTEADARGKMLVYLLENSLIKL